MTWDGKIERRSVDNRDRDLLIRIDANLTNLVSKQERHEIEDQAKFKLIFGKLDFQNKVIYGALGVVLFIEFMAKVVK